MQDLDTLKFCQALITPDDIQDTEDRIRKRVLKLFGRKNWIEKMESCDMLQWENSGFSLNASVRIEAWDKESLERLLPKLLAKVYEVFPLTCTCGEAMKIIAFITSPSIVRHILTHLKFLSNPFDPLPLEAREYENDSQLISETPDGLTSMLEPITSDDIYQENACSQLVPGTTDVF